MNIVMWTSGRQLQEARLKVEQVAVVEAFIGGQDVFAALPTGYGKSLCFAVLPYLFDELRGNSETRSIVLLEEALRASLPSRWQGERTVHCAV